MKRPSPSPIPTTAPDRPLPANAVKPLDWAQASGAVDPVLRAIEFHSRRRKTRVGRAVGAIALLIAVGFIAQHLARSPAVLSESSGHVVVTAPALQILPDGTRVELRDSATLSLDFQPGLRRVVLHGGAAHFAVTKDPARPFVVEARGVPVRAVGTAFTVDTSAGGLEVIVTEGRVAVTNSATLVHAGEHIAVGSDAQGVKPVVLTPAALAAKQAWRVPRLEFNSTPLAEVVAAFNRHAASHGLPAIVVADTSLHPLPLSGMLRSDNLGALLSVIEASYDVKNRREPDGRITLYRP